jgi:hypothetical protein
MQDKYHSNDSRDTDTVIELIARSLDEALSPQEQAQVNEAMQNSLAIRLAAEGLREFDALLKRTGMAIPEEGFPARVLARLEAYELRRTRAQWILTLAVIFLGSLGALLWLVSNGGVVVSLSVLLVSGAFVFIPLSLAFLFALGQFIGQGPLLLYAISVLVLTVLWARVSGGFKPSITPH